MDFYKSGFKYPDVPDGVYYYVAPGSDRGEPLVNIWPARLVGGVVYQMQHIPDGKGSHKTTDDPSQGAFPDHPDIDEPLTAGTFLPRPM